MVVKEELIRKYNCIISDINHHYNRKPLDRDNCIAEGLRRPQRLWFWLWCNGFIEAVTDQLWLIYTSLNLFYKYWSKFSYYDVIISDFTKMLISRILSSFSVSFHMLAILNYSFWMNQRLCTYLSIYLTFINHIKTKNME